MADHPARLEDLLRLIEATDDRAERIELLIGMADRFVPVPDSIASRPYDAEHRTPACESDVYVWAQDRGDGTLNFHFAVENPQGISAMAMAAILDSTLSGQPPEQVACVTGDIVYRIFGNELSMGKSMGLMGMVTMVQSSAKRKLDRSRA